TKVLEPESRVRAEVVEAMVRAPESVIAFAVKVSVPTTVLLANVPTPDASILTVPAPAPVAMDVTALNVPGARRSEGNDNVTAPVAAEAVIWLAVPAREVTPVFAMVMVSVALPVVEIPVPAAMVRVSPLE